ncbi:MAG: hypothetical protein IK065_02050, partial [Neisseriaceae bacterium]|nr:hypothetical protein [Neisseriaceae bacterium]
MSDINDTITDVIVEKYDLDKYSQAINVSVDAMVKFVTELSISQVAVAFTKEGFTETLTQQDIEAHSMASIINFAKKEKAEMLELATKEQGTNSVKATTYQYLADVWEKVADNNQKALDKLASNTLNDKIFDTLGKVEIVKNISKMTIDFVEDAYKDGFSGATVNGLDATAHTLHDIVYGKFYNELLVPKMDKIILNWGLNPKSLVMHAAKGGLIGLLLTAEYKFIKWATYEICNSETVHLFDREWFVSASDWIFGNLDKIAIGSDEFDAVASVYTLLQTNSDWGLTDDEWLQLLGSDEVRNMDIAKVKHVLAESIKIITGNEIKINTTEDMVNAVKENYEAFKNVRGFGLMVPLENTWKNFISEDSDFGLAMRYALKNLNNFIISSNKAEKINIDYSPFNQNGELDLYSINNKNGMTESYIQDRLNMLKFLYSNKLHDEEYQDLASGIILGNSLDAIYGHQADYSPMSDKSHSQIVFGTDGDDSEISGGSEADHLYGGAGNDTLKGGTRTIKTDSGDGYDFEEDEDDNSRDYLEGGVGFDTYYVGNKDMIFDCDMTGLIHFETKGKSIDKLELYKKAEVKEVKNKEEIIKTIYESDDHQFKAYTFSNSKDLMLEYQGSIVTIKNYLVLADEQHNLGITLKQAKETQDPPDFPTKDDSNPDNPIEPTEIYAQAKYNQATIYANVAVKYYGRQTGWDGLGIDNGGDYLSAASAKQLYAQMSKYG